jgi:protein TonB
MEPVTSILLDRAREDDNLRRMVVVSFALHVGIAAALIVGPAFRGGSEIDTTQPVMTISLGGAPGPRSGGLNPIGGRPVQTTEPATKPEAVRPPAAKAPEMTMPAPNAKPSKTPQPKTAPKEASGQTPTRGEAVAPGTAVAETGAKGMGFGLSTGGGGGTGSYLDVGDFCCPDYLSTMIGVINRAWGPSSQQGVDGQVLVKYTVQRNGQITDVQVERSSGYLGLDTAAQRALLMTRQLPPLPAEFTGSHLTVHLMFEYRR